MKGRSLFAGVLLFACLCVTPAHASVVSGGTEYLWYIEPGQVVQNENYEVTSYEGDALYISSDGGASYAELPGLREEPRRTWGRMDGAVTPLENGGLRVEARDQNATEYTWRRDYSLAELNKALERAVPTPVEILCANEAVTLGRRIISDQSNGDPTQVGYLGWGQNQYDHQLVWSQDGIAWTGAELPSLHYTVSEAWWDGNAFYLKEGRWDKGGYTSMDGVTWTSLEELPVRTSLGLTADLGRYHFEVVQTNGWYNEVYVMEQGSRGVGALLPHMGQGIRTRGIGVNELIANYGPDSTVNLAVRGNSASYSLGYPTLSLDWVLENLSVEFRDRTEPADMVDNGSVTLAKVAEHFRNSSTYEMEGELIRNDGTGWKKVENTPFSPVFELLPYNGKTFLVLDNAVGEKRLYASDDGLAWREVDALRPPELDESDTWGYADYVVIWTGEHYYVGMKAGERRHGMMGHAGGQWYGKNTQVWLLDEDFHVLSSHDFGGLVMQVGYLNGNYYALVNDTEGDSDHSVLNFNKGTYTLYRSNDGVTWQAMSPEYLELNAGEKENWWEQNNENYNLPILAAPEGGSLKGNLTTGDPNKPLRTVAQVGRWRFVLDKGWDGAPEPYLLKENASDRTALEKLSKAIGENWITPGEITAAWQADGKIEVTVTDLSTPTMKCSVAYTPEELDRMAVTDMGYRVSWTADNSKPGVADLTLVEMANGERELVYRTGAAEGKFLWYESVPWSNSIRLLPYNGKDFMVLDLADGKLWRSEDAQTWREAGGDWLQLGEGYEDVRYSLAWTGEHYLACCYLSRGSGDGRKVSREVGKVFLLDEELNILSSHDFGKGVERIGYRDGIYYAEVSEDHWDERERYGTFHTDGQESSNTLWSSPDGINWEKTDIIQVRECLQDV